MKRRGGESAMQALKSSFVVAPRASEEIHALWFQLVPLSTHQQRQCAPRQRCTAGAVIVAKQ